MATIIVDTYTGGPAKPTILKDPNALLDYSFNWAAYLAPIGDTISSAVFVLSEGLVQTNSFFSTTAAAVWVTGGTVGTTARVTCRITTTSGRVDDRSVFLKIVER